MRVDPDRVDLLRAQPAADSGSISSASYSPAVETLGQLTARALRGAWRSTPQPSAITVRELEYLVPHLIRTGTAGLAWWALRHQPELAETESARELEAVRRWTTLENALHRRNLEATLQICDELQLDPLVVKGWSLARLYPDGGMRACGDVDLVVADRALDRLAARLAQRPHDQRWIDVDLDHAFLRADQTPLPELVARAARATLDGRAVGVLGVEDTIRLVAIHYMRSGGFRALSLCDLAMALERADVTTDWSLVVPPGRRGRWVRVAAGLAESLLGADLSETPLHDSSAVVPSWVHKHVLTGFGTAPAERALPPHFSPSLDPRQLAAQLAERWPPDPLELVVHYRRRVPARRPFGLQVYDSAVRGLGLVLPLRADRVPRRRRRMPGR